jgi:hypothetical protein
MLGHLAPTKLREQIHAAVDLLDHVLEASPRG